MTKKLLSWLSILIVFMTLLWSCHNEDFAKIEPDPQRNNAGFFKHSSLNTKSGVDYINILEAYNEETNFLSTMPDQKGMPIWDKMQIVDTENATGLMIPLSHDNETMSSVLFVTLDGRNAVTGVKDYDNALLQDIVYNEGIDIKTREKMFYTFMYMDNKTFGNELFTNAPKGILDDMKFEPDNGRIWIKDFKEPEHVHNETSKFLYIESCGSTWSCKNHESWSNCDHCPACYTTSCGIITVWIPDEPFPGGGGGSSSSGGGGGGGGGTSTPPKDPCTLSSTFYRLAPGCGGGGVDPFDDPFDPCKKAKPSIDKANEILHSTAGQTMDVALKGKADAQNEWTLALGQYPDNSYQVTAVVEGGEYGANPPVGLLNSAYIGDGHAHSGKPGNPSAGDLYGMLEIVKVNPNFNIRFVYGIEGGIKDTYVLVLTDQAAAEQFLTDYPRSGNYDPLSHGFKARSKLFEDIDNAMVLYKNNNSGDVSGESYNRRVLGLAYMLEKNNSGLSIAKVDANGNLKKINVYIEEITNPNGLKEDKVIVSKCP